MCSKPIRGCYKPIRLHSQWARGGELGDEHSPVILSQVIANAPVTGRDQNGDAAGAEGTKVITNKDSIVVGVCTWLEYDSQGIDQSTCVLGVAIADRDHLREVSVSLGQHMLQPL